MAAHDVAAWLTLVVLSAPAGAASVSLRVLDESGAPLPARLHLRDARGQPVQAPGLPFWHDHFSCPGTAELSLPPGMYEVEAERGPEYRPARATLQLPNNQPVQSELVLRRIADLPAENWWPGDLHVHRPPAEVPLLMQAEDLYIAPVITWWNKANPWRDQPLPAPALQRHAGRRFSHLLAGEDERRGGALLLLNLPRPLDLAAAQPEFPSTQQFLLDAKSDPAAWVDVEKPFWWDVPLWLASGRVDSIGLANNHMCRSQMLENEAWGRPRDALRWPAPRGNGFWSLHIYEHVLQCGLRIPPSAGSASGVLPNPLGYNRVYAHVSGELTYERWFEALRAGRVVVTNGPLLRCRVQGELPGHVFRSPGEPLQLTVAVDLIANDPLESLEVVYNGQVVAAASRAALPAPGRPAQLKFGPVACPSSGWLQVRTLATPPETFRFAASGPYYLEVGAAPRRISRRSVQFFIDWLAQRREQLHLADPKQQRQVLAFHDQARAFWQQLLPQANAP
jgi:hypothetical protein